MRVITTLLLAFTTLFTTIGFSQVPTQQIDPTYISISDGLSSPNVQDVMQDSYGLLWIATTNGIQKYDGYRFESFKNIPGKPTSLQNNNAWGLEEDGNHDIWVATDFGASKYDRSKNEFINYSFSKIFNIDIAGGRAFNIFKDSQDKLWAVTQFMELVSYDPGTDQWTFAPYNIPDISQPNHNSLAIAITEDLKGGMWFGSTAYGLMYRPINETAFKPIPKELLGGFDFVDSENFITSLYSDSTNTLWITTRNGVYKYNPKFGTVKTIVAYSEAKIEVLNYWNRILLDKQGNIWIGNNFRGILKFDGISDSYEEISLAGKVKMRGLGWNITITDFMIDKSGIFWFASRESGLVKYDPVNKPFSHLAHDDSNPSSISPNGVYGILASKTKPGTIFVGTRGSGINIYDPVKRTFEKVPFKAIDDRYGGSARSIFEDLDGTLWIGTWGDGLIKLDKNYKEVERYKYESQNATTISNNQVRIIRQDQQKKLWIGTNNGLNIFDPSTGIFQRLLSTDTKAYPVKLIKEIERLFNSKQEVGIIDHAQNFEEKSKPVEIKMTGDYWVMAVGEGSSGSMADFGWIENAAKDTIWDFKDYGQTLYAGGAAKNRILIGQLNLQKGSYSLHYRTDDSHAYDQWNEAEPDLTTLYGIALVKPADENQSRSFQQLMGANQNDLVVSGNNILDIEIGATYVWVSANNEGLNKIDPVNKTVKYYRYDPNNENSLSSDVILDIFEDRHGMIWLATNTGVNMLDPNTEKFTRYTEIDGLPTNLTEAILEGDNGEMWIATQNGLSQMVTNESLRKVTFINYNSSDGLGGDIFISQGAAHSPDGRFYFGGEHGLTTFSNVTANNVPPDLVISNLLISNKSVLDMGSDSPLIGNLMNANEINLSYKQNNLSFDFAALHFANPEKNQYAHKLVGYDQDWIYDNRNFASYTNLDPGKYEFAIRASNAYGIWNEEGKTLLITISPPWWKTWWAYILYAILLSTGIFVVDQTLRRRIKLKERERSREKELAQAKEIEKAYAELKNTQSQLVQSEKMASLGELTAGIAHEIQNPLNFVNNFSEVNSELIAEMKQELSKGNLKEAITLSNDIDENEKKIIFHGKRADSIVKGMLQHSRSSNGKKEPTDINALADEYLRLAYHGLRAKDKTFNAKMKTEFEEQIGNINVVPQEMGRVILNLITNAFYAVSEKASLANRLNGSLVAEGATGGKKYEPMVTVCTKKMGNKVEISVKDNGSGIPKKVKEKIFQPFFTTKPTGQGTGLGLSMSYDIVTKTHGGTLTVVSEEGDGTTFIILIPVA